MENSLICSELFKKIVKKEDLKNLISELLNGITGIDKSFLYENMAFVNEENSKNKKVIVEFDNEFMNIYVKQKIYKKWLKLGASAMFKQIGVCEGDTDITHNISIFFNARKPLSKKIIEVYHITIDDETVAVFDGYTSVMYNVNLSLVKEKYDANKELSMLEKLLLMLYNQAIKNK